MRDRPQSDRSDTGVAVHPTLSVVVASTTGGLTLERCLRALERACAGIEAEVLLVGPGSALAPDRGSRALPIRSVVGPEGALVPELWAAGLRSSRGRVVAFTLSSCLAGPGWARALVDAVDAGATGAGGALALGAGTSLSDWAVYLLRYSAFLPPRDPTSATIRVPEIPGDNAAYDRAALERHASSFGGGFWEVDFHHRIRREGGFLVRVPAATVTFAGDASLGAMLGHRFRHGCQSGAFRTRELGIPRWRSLLAAPLVPVVLTSRVLRRTGRHGGYLLRAIACLPVLLALGSAWAAGEAVGAWRTHAHEPGRVSHGLGH